MRQVPGTLNLIFGYPMPSKKAIAAKKRNAMPKICIDRTLPGKSPLDIARHGESARAAVLAAKLWTPSGRTLRIRFLDGDPKVQAKVARFAQDWTKYANLKFAFGDDPAAEIRISFLQPGSWSFIGTDALDPSIPADQPTMNLGWLKKSTPNDEVKRVVLHEFGHALGLVHEHQNPVNTIPWNKDAVYDFYQGPPNYWSPDAVEINLFQVYDKAETKFSVFDPLSIMLYPIPQQLTLGGFEIGWNNTLSDLDKQYMREWYP